MIRLGKSVHFLLVFVALCIMIQLAAATAMNITVPAGQEKTKTVNLAVDDHFLVRFTVAGQSDNTIDFYIVDPQGDTKAEFIDIGNVNYDFVCTIAGNYTLRFSNNDSSESKLVTLDYEIQHYIFGMPQMLFLTIIVVLGCVGAVAVFILMSKQH